MCDKARCHYIVKEFIDGKNLFSATINSSTNEILHLLIKICSVIQYLHLRGILHLALKPTNVILPDGDETGDNLRIADFGLINWRGSSKESESLDIETYRQAAEFLRIGNRAVQRAQEESRRLNVPNVYSHTGTLYYELPDGRLTTEDPFRE